MKRCLFAAMTFLALVSPVWANDALTISGQSLNWNPTSQSSPQFTVGIENVGDTDLLIAWSVQLEIVPVGSASGLSFASVTMPTTNYLLGSNSDGFVGTIGTGGSSLYAFDSVYTEGPVSVPASGDNLLSATFSAASGAQGVFNIEAVPDPYTGSYWYSSNSGETTFVQYAFANVPFGTNDPPVVIGQVSLTSGSSIPEPQSVWLVVSGLATLATYKGIRQIRLRR